MKNDVILCLDIGGTNFRMGLVDREYGLSHVKIVSTAKTAEGGFVAGLTREIQTYLDAVSDHASVRAVSVGVPATVDKAHTTVLQAPNVPGLDNQPVVAMLEDALKLPVFLEKDVNLLVTYDLMEQQLPEDSTIIGIYFGTGIGNAICINGKLHAGKNGVAGELGHIPQIHSHTRCGCGMEGCVEPMGGGRRLTELCDSLFPDTPISDIYRCHGSHPSVCEQIDAMAATVATEVNILDPDYVIIGGGLPQMKGFPVEYFLECVKKHTRPPYPRDTLDIRFARPNQENGIIGAGIYGWKQLSK